MNTPWFEVFRLIALGMIWMMFPLQVWSVCRGLRQFRRWEADEERRTARWQRDMDEAGKMREEAFHLRAQAEVALAQARRQHLDGSRGLAQDLGKIAR